MSMNHTQPSYMRETADYAQCDRDVRSPEPDTHKNRLSDDILNEQEKEVQFLCETMRRIEDLADRLGGATPTAEGTSGEKVHSFPEGLMGAFTKQHYDRMTGLRRMSDALSRIERIV